MTKKSTNSTASKHTVFRQLCNLIPPHLVSEIARRNGSKKHARSFSHYSHIVALIYAKVTHSFGLNDVSDALQNHSGPLSAIRGATAPARNTLSHANKYRPAKIAEELFWEVLNHLRSISPGFGRRRFPGKLRKLTRNIHLIDSTVIELVANCMDWASHRRRKAAAKCHLRLDFENLLPSYAVIDVAREHDNRRARELSAGLKAGEILIMDRGYVDLVHFQDLSERGVIWVTRMKATMKYDVWKDYDVAEGGPIISDQWVCLTNGLPARVIVARVMVDGKEREMTFVTNQMEWAASTIVELYRCRWEIEVFFKQMKQTLKLCDLMSYSANGIRWQIWIAMLVQMLMRYLAWESNWSHSFVRLYGIVRSVIWKKASIRLLLEGYGTAGGLKRWLAEPQEAYLPGFG